MAPAKTRKRKSDQELPAESSVKASPKAGSKSQRMLPVRAKDGEAAPETTSASVPAPGNLKVFTDDDDFIVKAPAPVLVPKPAAPVEEDEEEDSDDEAPEAVSTTRAASDVKKSQAAQKVSQEQAASQKRKRQERDALFKKQADERKKLEEEAKTQNAASAEDEDEDEDAEDAQLEAGSRGRRTGKVQIPNLLPAEFLDSSSEDESEDDQETEAARPKKRKVTTIERTLARQDRGPRDARVGSTVYRVAKKADERMAPKLQKHAKTSKDLLLKRNRSVAQSRSGFLVGK